MKPLLMIFIIAAALVAAVQSQGYGRAGYEGNGYGQVGGYRGNDYGYNRNPYERDYEHGTQNGRNGYGEGYGVPGIAGSPSFTLML
ncbi:prisilkin-39-like [Fopius arisanus]|uniref:Prisilkin-39-like n=1 Tax=Fopius arisanus TaxID=64838 RepID=A0A9R1U1Q3_9HYME|nr:PREDICTED: prisilkin-39-like [Fopius arisanus]